FWRAIKRPDDWRFEHLELDLGLFRRALGRGTRRGNRGWRRCSRIDRRDTSRRYGQPYRQRGSGPPSRAARLLRNLQAKAVLLELELCHLVLAHELQNSLDLVEIHQPISIKAVDAFVSTSTPSGVASTSSSIRTPPQPGK